MAKAKTPAPILGTERPDTVAEIAAEIAEKLEDREKAARRFKTAAEAARATAARIEKEIDGLLEDGDDPEAVERLTNERQLSLVRADLMEKKLAELEAVPVLTRAEYTRLKNTILDAAEIERQAFIDMLAAHAGTLAAEASELVKYQNRVNETLHKLQFEAYHDENRTEERNGRRYFYPATPEAVDFSGLARVSRSLMLSPLLSGRVTFKDRAELSDYVTGESVE